jgi:phosphoketolase
MSQVSPVVLMARCCPILHLNRYKISSPTIYATMSDTELDAYFRGCGWSPRAVDVSHGEDPDAVTGKELDAARAELRSPEGPPMIILRSAKGAGVRKTDPHGTPLAGTFHAHQVPLPHAADDPEELKLLGKWLRSYRPEELGNEANGGLLRRELPLPRLDDFAGPEAARALPGWSGVWQWASTDCHRFPDIVFAWAGTTPTVETVAAVRLPQLRKQGATVWSSGCRAAAPAAAPCRTSARTSRRRRLWTPWRSAMSPSSRFGIETSIVPGAFTTGTNRFAPAVTRPSRLSSRPTSSSTRA